MSDVTSTSVDPYWDLGIISQSIRWQPPHMGIIVVELFAGIGAGLAAVLELELIVQRYIHVDSALVPCRAARQHINHLMARFPEKLSRSAVDKTFLALPNDVSLIFEVDLRRLGHVDLLSASWPCQGHSRAGGGHELDDPRSNLFWELMWIMDWWFKHQSTPLGYIMENVPPLSDTRSKVVDPGRALAKIY